MTMRQFIKQNRDDLDRIIREAIRNPDAKINNRERGMWILNDEELYMAARRAGVRI